MSSVQEVVPILFSKLLYKMGADFLDIVYKFRHSMVKLLDELSEQQELTYSEPFDFVFSRRLISSRNAPRGTKKILHFFRRM